jgi:hypothetical protein
MIQFKNGLKGFDKVVTTTGQANSKSGVEGVFKCIRSNFTYWVAQWVDRNGKKRSKSFSVKAYGEEEAFELACQHRNEMLK